MVMWASCMPDREAALEKKGSLPLYFCPRPQKCRGFPSRKADRANSSVEWNGLVYGQQCHLQCPWQGESAGRGMVASEAGEAAWRELECEPKQFGLYYQGNGEPGQGQNQISFIFYLFIYLVFG